MGLLEGGGGGVKGRQRERAGQGSGRPGPGGCVFRVCVVLCVAAKAHGASTGRLGQSEAGRLNRRGSTASSCVWRRSSASRSGKHKQAAGTAGKRKLG